MACLRTITKGLQVLLEPYTASSPGEYFQLPEADSSKLVQVGGCDCTVLRYIMYPATLLCICLLVHGLLCPLKELSADCGVP